jgi:hypothetical protein
MLQGSRWNARRARCMAQLQHQFRSCTSGHCNPLRAVSPQWYPALVVVALVTTIALGVVVLSPFMRSRPEPISIPVPLSSWNRNWTAIAVQQHLLFDSLYVGDHDHAAAGGAADHDSLAPTTDTAVRTALKALLEEQRKHWRRTHSGGGVNTGRKPTRPSELPSVLVISDGPLRADRSEHVRLLALMDTLASLGLNVWYAQRNGIIPTNEQALFADYRQSHPLPPPPATPPAYTRGSVTPLLPATGTSGLAWESVMDWSEVLCVIMTHALYPAQSIVDALGEAGHSDGGASSNAWAHSNSVKWRNEDQNGAAITAYALRLRAACPGVPFLLLVAGTPQWTQIDFQLRLVFASFSFSFSDACA